MKAKFKIQNIFKGDAAIWFIFFVLSVISLISVFSSIGLYAIADNHTTPMHLFVKHAAFVAASYVAIIAITPLKTNLLYKLANWVFLFSGVLVFLALVQHTRWIGILGIRFQPSEVVKLGITLFMARMLQNHRDELDSPKFFGFLLAVTALVAIAIFPENFSTAALIFLACLFAMLFAGVNLRNWLYAFGAIAVIGLLMLLFFYKFGDSLEAFRSSTWSHRIEAWLHPIDPSAPNPQLTQEAMAKMAIASGGFWGHGIGNTVHARLMTQAHNDFIFAIIIEELGAVGGIIIFALYTVFFRRCIKIVKKCRDLFSATIVAGFGTIIYFQALVNMSVAVGLLPVTGQTLPFVSYGGTAYLILSCGIGMIQCVAYNIKKQEKNDETEEYTE